MKQTESSEQINTTDSAPKTQIEGSEAEHTTLFTGYNMYSQWEGAIPFQKSLEIQEKLKPLAKKGAGFFLGFESCHGVITKGLGTEAEDILWPEKQLAQKKISLISLKRGGKATLHAPGQLVIYPVIHLASFKWLIKDFILSLENMTREFLLDLGVAAGRKEEKYSGLSTARGKIAFFGIQVSEGVSQHGLSINVSNDLDLFHSIKSCGVKNRPHDKLKDHQISLTTKELFEKWTARATPIFNQRCHRRKNPELYRQIEPGQSNPP